MGQRAGLLFLLVLGISWLCTDARTIIISDFSAMQINQKESKNASQESGADISDTRICTTCEQFSAQAIDYLSDENNQAKIIGSLHLACSQLHPYKKECIRLVDYYTPLFFQEVATVQPKDFCEKVNLCDETVFTDSGSCDVCHKVVKEIQDQLKDPDTELEIIEQLLKACEVIPGYAKKCKVMVFQYGLLVLAKTEKFLEKEDLCAFIHMCKKHSTSEDEAESSLLESPLLEMAAQISKSQRE